MTRAYVTGNHAAGHALAAAGEANRDARGCCSGIYPITPQTEMAEYLSAAAFSRGAVVPVESEHSAMAVCIGAAIDGARSFTATSSNGLLYMTENIYAAGYFRLPIVMVVSNRTLGPPWNIWVDQGDTLSVRDAAWLQFYCESHQDLVDTILLAFRVAEDHRILLPVMVAQDGFIASHTQMVVDLPDQELVDEYLPDLDLPHAIDVSRPRTYGNLTWPTDTQRQREEIQAAMERVPVVLAEAIDEFERVFGRRPDGAFATDQTDDAEVVVVTTSTVTRTARDVVASRRRAGDRLGMVKVKLFRPFLREQLVAALGSAERIAVLDRNHSPGSGGIIWGEVASSLQRCPDRLAQGYIVGLGGGDVTADMVEEVVDDVKASSRVRRPIFVEAAS
jgi:pyruvate/2-oxoacid:ferredoxin oxidoreductase alpha subunit